MRGCVGVVVAMLLALCACTSEADQMGPVQSTRAAVTASPTLVVERPVKPEQRPTRQSAEAFVKYFWATYNYGYDAGDPSLMEEISQPSCMYCKSVTENMKSVAAARSVERGSKVTVLGSATPEYKIVKGIIVASMVRQDSGTSTTREGEVTRLKGYKAMNFTTAVDWSGSSWAIAGVTYDEKSREEW